METYWRIYEGISQGYATVNSIFNLMELEDERQLG